MDWSEAQLAAIRTWRRQRSRSLRLSIYLLARPRVEANRRDVGERLTALKSLTGRV